MKYLGMPRKYIQGRGALNELPKVLGNEGSAAVTIGDPIVLGLVGDRIRSLLEESGVKYAFYEFSGESTETECSNASAIAAEIGAQYIIGVGGGKTMDTARATAYKSGCEMVAVPTIAASDAPASSLAGIYSEDHEHLYTIRTRKNPEAVIVDTEILVNAPVRFFVAGMGDALATKFEAEACAKAGKLNIHGGAPTLTSLVIADLCYETVLKYGRSAKDAVLKKEVSDAFERVVEASILMSGIGFESGGLAAAHGLHSGFTVLEDTQRAFHGEKVAFSTIVQVILERRPDEEINEIIRFCIDVGLPVTLAELGIVEDQEAKIEAVCNKACAPGGYVRNMPFAVTVESLKEAIFEADSRGRGNLAAIGGRTD